MARLMLPYLTGESVYSYVARSHVCSTNKTCKSSNLLFFNSENIRLHPYLPAHVIQVAVLANVDEYRLLIEGTCFCLMSFALNTRSHKISLMKAMLGEHGGFIPSISGNCSSKLSFESHLSLCPRCLSEDCKLHGLSYWHLEHQLPGITVCPTHHVQLSSTLAGEGGVNHQYVFPNKNLLQPDKRVNKREHRLSNYITLLHRYLNCISPLQDLSEFYKLWLDGDGYLTEKKHIRWRKLKSDLVLYWEDLFHSNTHSLPLEISDFHFVPTMVHHPRNMHYIKHVLLMAFLSKTPEEFFNRPAEAEKESETKGKPVRNIEEHALKLLHNGNSMRNIASQLSCSIGYLKQLALRNGIEIERRRQHITAEIERTVWRKAFYGIHREVIANELNISIGAVEQIIQSHEGVSQWRHHLLMVRRLMARQKELLEFIASHPRKPRNYIKKHCGAYMWLYKNNKDWLYQHLPPAQSRIYYPSVDWSARDIILVAQLMSLNPIYSSLSQIDRELGGHGWLLKYKNQLPMSLEIAKQLLVLPKV